MAKIGLDLRFYRSGTGGIGRYSRNLLKELLQIDHDNHYTAIITPDDEPEFTLQAPNLSRLVVPIKHFSPSEQSKLASVLNKEKFDLVHFANFNHPLLYGRPFVVTIHDMIMHLFPGTVQKRSLIHRLAYRLIFNDAKRAKRIIVPSNATRNDLVKKLGFNPEKIVVTPEGSEGLFRLHSEEEKTAIREKYHLPKRYLLFVSRWEKYKGLPALIEAYNSLRAKYADLGLVVAGRPDSQNPEIAELVKKEQETNERLVTPGFINDADLAALYSAATVYVHPSWYEGFGIMILEAFASGVPVVTSHNSSLPEVVGEAGLLIDPHQPTEIADAVEKILTDEKLAKDLIAKGQERLKRYSWRQMAEQTLSIYKEVLQKNR